MITATKLASQGNDIRQIQSESPLWAIIAKAIGSLHENAADAPPLTREQWLAAISDLQGVAQSDLLAFTADQLARTFIRSGNPGLNVPVPEPLVTTETLAVTASRNLAETDKGKTLLVASASDITLSAPTTLSTGFWVRILRMGAGEVAVAATGGSTVNSQQGRLRIEHQYGWAETLKTSGTGFVVYGDLKA